MHADISVKNCYDIWEASEHEAASGLYTVQPGIAFGHTESFVVYCDMESFPEGGGWTVILRRVDGNGVKFDQPWTMYRNGFGDFQQNFWLGLEKMRLLTNGTAMELFVGLVRFKNSKTAYARYGMFQVGAESSHYPLYIGNFDDNSPAGDSLRTHDGQPFTTVDQDNDKSGGMNCALFYGSGWWYKDCQDSDLNGKYYNYDAGEYPPLTKSDGIIWSSWLTKKVSLKEAVMAIRPVQP